MMSTQSRCCLPSCLSFHCTRLCTVFCHLRKHFACTYLCVPESNFPRSSLSVEVARMSLGHQHRNDNNPSIMLCKQFRICRIALRERLRAYCQLLSGFQMDIDL